MISITRQQFKAFDDYLLLEFARKTSLLVADKLSLDCNPTSPEVINELYKVINLAQAEYGFRSMQSLQEFVFYYFTFPVLQKKTTPPSIRILLQNHNLREELRLEQLYFHLKSISA